MNRFLYESSILLSPVDYFQARYTDRDEPIIIHHEAQKYFDDHDQPNSLTNIAAPKIFSSEQECITWVKAGLDRSKTSHDREQSPTDWG